MRRFPYFWTAAFILLVDRLTKLVALHFLEESESLAVWPGFFHITRVNNTGAAFGILRGERGLLLAASWIGVFFLFFYIAARWRRAPQKNLLPWALILAGALGNGYDRLRYGMVIDFLDFRVWPVFNVADASITIGVLLILIQCIPSFSKQDR
ncbi:MAG: signal peptidase II [Candidatus Omnitrophica bacterium]|nr:signal peptidase II [Candidatus Omnitrophota bacterium]